MPWLLALLLNPRAAIIFGSVAVLIGSHWWAWHDGHTKATDDMQANAMSKALANEQAARKREQELLDQLNNTEQRYINERKTSDAAHRSAVGELNRLRIAVANQHRVQSCTNPTPTTGHDATPSASTGELFGECAASLVEVARDADAIADQLRGLQQYINTTCTTPHE